MVGFPTVVNLDLPMSMKLPALNGALRPVVRRVAKNVMQFLIIGFTWWEKFNLGNVRPALWFCGWWQCIGRADLLHRFWCWWHSLNRGQCGTDIFPPSTPLAALQDDATVFSHARSAGFHSILYQQISNGGVGRIFTA